MNKRYLHHLLKQLQKFRYAYLVVALVATLGVFILSYRHNNLRALELRDKVLQVDKSSGDVEAALRELRTYTYAHMNADLDTGSSGIYPPVQLKYHYERLVAAEKLRVEAANSNLYTQAQAHCERLLPGGVSRDRVPCIQDYISTRNPVAANAIPDAQYKFDFTAPVWSPDLAGWSLLLAGFLAAALAVRAGLEYWLRASLRNN